MKKIASFASILAASTASFVFSAHAAQAAHISRSAIQPSVEIHLDALDILRQKPPAMPLPRQVPSVAPSDVTLKWQEGPKGEELAEQAPARPKQKKPGVAVANATPPAKVRTPSTGLAEASQLAKNVTEPSKPGPKLPHAVKQRIAKLDQPAVIEVEKPKPAPVIEVPKAKPEPKIVEQAPKLKAPPKMIEEPDLPPVVEEPKSVAMPHTAEKTTEPVPVRQPVARTPKPLPKPPVPATKSVDEAPHLPIEHKAETKTEPAASQLHERPEPDAPEPTAVPLEPKPFSPPLPLPAAPPPAKEKGMLDSWFGKQETPPPAPAENAPPAPPPIPAPVIPELKAPLVTSPTPPAAEVVLKPTTADIPPIEVSKPAPALPPLSMTPAVTPPPPPPPVMEEKQADKAPPPLPPLPKHAADAKKEAAKPQKNENPFDNPLPPEKLAAIPAKEAPVLAQPPSPAPVVAEEKVASLPPPEKISGTDKKPDLRIAFQSSETSVALSMHKELDALAEKLGKNEDIRVTIVAYASGSADQPSTARRVSLSRALAIRAYLIDRGISNLRINVQAEGNADPQDAADRVDVFLKSPSLPAADTKKSG